jgi:hypothetical protein
MISLWWLFLIVPASACVGFLACGLIVASKARDIDNDTDL